MMTKTAPVIAGLAIPLVVIAFWPAYFSRLFADVDGYTHLHALTGSLWLLLLAAQPLAIRHERDRLHIALGKLTYLLAPLFVVAGLLLSHYRLATMSEETFAAEGFSHYLPFYATAVFAVAYVLGLRHRDEAAAHGRFMLLTAIPLIDPVIGRLLFFYLPPLPSPWLYQAFTFSLATVVAGYLVFSYRGRGPARRDLIGYFVFLIALEVGWFTASTTAYWTGVMRWFRSLPLT